MKMEHTQCSETSAIKHHTPGNNPKDYKQKCYVIKADQVWFCSHISGHFSVAVFINEDANTYNAVDEKGYDFEVSKQ
jgi:hypothetical protein